MSRAIGGEPLRGHLDLLVLAVVQGAPGHGYEITQRLRLRSGGVLDVAEGTLYPALHRLEGEGLLKSRWQTGDGGPKRRVYRVTAKGTRRLDGKRREWEVLSTAIDQVVESESGV
jgi:transcriptional regulator